MHFRLIHSGLDVAPILAELGAVPELWDADNDRTARDNSPHAASSDVWLRYFPRDDLRTDADFNREGRCVFYPAWARLPSLHRIVWALMSTLQATELGGCLITRLQPGGRILPHADDSWHARFFNRKTYIPLKSNPWCINRCEDEVIGFRAGEIWEFNNLVEHEVRNDGPDERITVILCFHSEADK
jgi:hypothetical protein